MKNILKSYPAYDIVEAKTNTFGVKNLTAGTSLALRFDNRDDHNHLHHYMIGSVASSAVEDNDCPIKSIERAVANGHQLHFIFALGTCITAQKQARKEYVEVSLGDKVYFEGRLFVIQPANNNNLHLEQIEEAVYYQTAGQTA